jgi:TusA-related sulfurtransferase
MHTHIRQLAMVSIVFGCTGLAAFAQHPAMPHGMTHEQHLARMQKDAELKRRGAAAMGFDQENTAHHFRLSETGGAIEVVTNDPAADATIGFIRTHLKEIAADFSRGDFSKPFATHGEVPPGVRAMQERKNALAFRYEDLPGGGRVRITTSDANATNAVHEFLRYQIREHATGDPLLLPKE